jgi:prevent-host-death family protein
VAAHFVRPHLHPQRCTVYRLADRTVHQEVTIPRIIASEDLRAGLGRELDAVRRTQEALYVSKRGRLAGVLLDSDQYAELLERIDYLEDSLAALQARVDRDQSVAWDEVRE